MWFSGDRACKAQTGLSLPNPASESRTKAETTTARFAEWDLGIEGVVEQEPFNNATMPAVCVSAKWSQREVSAVVRRRETELQAEAIIFRYQSRRSALRKEADLAGHPCDRSS